MITPEQMANLYARAFGGHGRAWSAAEFADLLNSPHVFAVGDTRAFALGRVILDDAELLTIATDPDSQQGGLGRACLQSFEAEAAGRGGKSFFLEVAEDNFAARALYDRAGYAQAARRVGYYKCAGLAPVDALILRKTVD